MTAKNNLETPEEGAKRSLINLICFATYKLIESKSFFSVKDIYRHAFRDDVFQSVLRGIQC